jgi:hypothetical protein
MDAGVIARISGSLALSATIWHNWKINGPSRRSLIAYDHTPGIVTA